MELFKIVDIREYLQKLADMDKVLICIAVKDTPGFCLNGEINGLLSNLGVRTNLINKHQQSYVGLVFNKKSYREKLVKDNISFLDVHICGLHVQLLSKGFQLGNESSICINNLEYSINERGLNIVVVDSRRGRIIDSVCFDTHAKDLKCYRNGDCFDKSRMIEHSDNDYVLGIESKLNQLLNEIKSLKTDLETLSYQAYVMNLSVINQLSVDDKDPRITLFEKMPTATGSLRKLQLLELELLKRLDSICRDKGITYCTCFGNLLGAIRHRGFVPWDDDMDIIMMRDQFELLKKAITNDSIIDINDSWIIGRSGPHRRMIVHFKGYYDPFIDIFIFDYCKMPSDYMRTRILQLRSEFVLESNQLLKNMGINGNPLSVDVKKMLQEMCDKYSKEISSNDDGVSSTVVWSVDNLTTRKKVRSVELSYLQPVTDVQFEGYSIMAPANIDKILTLCYDNYYMLPNDIMSHRHLDHNALEKQCDEICEQYGIHLHGFYE